MPAVLLDRSHAARLDLRVLQPHEHERIPTAGAVTSVQEAEVRVPDSLLERLWTPESLERLARTYWRFLSRITLSLIRVVYGDDSRTVVLLTRRLPLLRFHAPRYEGDGRRASVTWRIARGLLVAREGRGRGHLRIEVERLGEGANPVLLRIRVEVANFYPWLRGHGRFARFGGWLYANTQMRIHVFVCRRFLRSLARLDLAPTRIGELRAEIDDRGEREGAS